MILSWIRTSGFRNLMPDRVCLAEGLNIFFGPNAQGKTNFLEAVALLADGRSFRGARITEMIRSGESDACIEGQISGDNTELNLKVYMNRSSRQYHIDDKPVSDLREFLGRFSYVVYASECMAIVDGDPSARRNFLDHGYFGLKPSYLLTLRSYRKILKSRNATIKQAPDNERLITAWNEPLCRYGASIAHSRRLYLEQVCRQAEEEYRCLADDKEQLTIEYSSQWMTKETLETNDEKCIYENMRDGLEREISSDIRRGSTMIGPHRDELRIMIDGKDIRWYGSRGQKRTALMAMKLAELRVFHAEKNEFPVLILDDMSSEFDEYRRDSLIQALPENIQILISHTEKLHDHFDQPAQYFKMANGCVTGC